MFKNKERKAAARRGELDKAKSTLVNGSEYPFRLNFYDKPPLYEVTIEEFETCALDRLRVLAEIEASFARNRQWEELRAVTENQCKKYLQLNNNSATSVDLQTQRRNDHLGHFVLRLAFCRSEELRRRFVKAESALFKVRYETDGLNERAEFLKAQQFDWVEVDQSEKKQFEHELQTLEAKLPTGKPLEYLKVHWTRVPDLVAKRRVFLRGGYAYVPGREVSSFVFNEFERKLERALEYTARSLPRMDEDTRLLPILNNLSEGFLAGVPSEWVNPSASGDEIRADMIDDLARKHFPLCMRNLHECLVRDHHLKHFGRLQYGLFLKVLGLPIEEALVFWRKSLSGKSDDEFNKEYKYNIRHSYGLEGKRANYPARSCQQILTTHPPGAGECHGCPYRHFSPENLQSSLLATYSSQSLTTTDLHEIMKTVKEGHYHVACTRVFEITHASQGVKKGEGVGGGESIVHPNQYAAKSIELEKPQQSDATVVVESGP